MSLPPQNAIKLKM